jgi:hypothetical protein
MIFGDGNVINTPGAWGVQGDVSRPRAPMAIMRTPQGVLPETRLTHVPSWGRIGITPNGEIISFGGAAADEAISALDKLGPRGAALLGAGAGLVFSTNRLMGAVVGGGLGYLAGKYLAGIIKTTLAIQSTAQAVAKVG